MPDDPGEDQPLCGLCGKPIASPGKTGQFPKYHAGGCYKQAKRNRWQANRRRRANGGSDAESGSKDPDSR